MTPEEASAVFERLGQYAVIAVRDALLTAAEIVRTAVVERTPVGTGDGPWGHLANSITVGDPYVVGSTIAVNVGTPAHYAEVIEEGRRPGARMPPPDAIARWVWGKRYIFPQVKTRDDAAALGFVIARSIAVKGITGRHMFRDGVAAVEAKAKNVFRASFDARIRKFTEMLEG